MQKILSMIISMGLLLVASNVKAKDSNVYTMELPGIVVTKSKIKDSEYHNRLKQQRSMNMESTDVVIAIAMGDPSLVAGQSLSTDNAVSYNIKLKNGKHLILYSNETKFNKNDCLSVYLADKVNDHPVLVKTAGKDREGLCKSIRQKIKG